MAVMWGIHNDRPELDLVGDGFVSIGWDRMGDLTAIGDDRQAMKDALAAAYPTAKPGAIPVWAGVLVRFGFELAVGDLVVHPDKAERTLDLGRVSGPYRYERTAPTHRHRRPVTWLQTGIPRELLSQTARWEIGSSLTLFQVRQHTEEIRRLLR